MFVLQKGVREPGDGNVYDIPDGVDQVRVTAESNQWHGSLEIQGAPAGGDFEPLESTEEGTGRTSAGGYSFTGGSSAVHDSYIVDVSAVDRLRVPVSTYRGEPSGPLTVTVEPA